MEIALTALENYLHADDRYPPLIRIAFLHYQFEAIHPFIDGNGRVGRLLISLLLVHWNLLPLPLLYLSAFFERHRDRYIGLLFSVSARSSWREWVMFFLEGVAEQARDAVNRAKRLQDLQQAWRDRFTHEWASNSVLLLLESLFVSPFVTIPLVQRELHISYPTAQRAVERLVRAGVLRQIGEVAYGRWYVAEDVLRAVGE